MAYIRKTIDMYELHVDYGYGLEHECSAPSRILINEMVKEYRENAGSKIVNMKTKKVREPLSNYDASQLKAIEKEIRAGRDRWLERRAKAKAV